MAKVVMMLVTVRINEARVGYHSMFCMACRARSLAIAFSTASRLSYSLFFTPKHHLIVQKVT